MMRYVDYIYETVLAECESLDAIYESYITYLVGHIGLEELKKHKLVETCGVVNGCQLYVLIKKG